jgi:hypothetical protein
MRDTTMFGIPANNNECIGTGFFFQGINAIGYWTNSSGKLRCRLYIASRYAGIGAQSSRVDQVSPVGPCTRVPVG